MENSLSSPEGLPPSVGPASLAEIVAAHPFWQGLPHEYLPALVRAAALQRFGVGDVIFQERHEADHLYLLHQGQVALEAFMPGQGVTTLQVLAAGEALGWSWLFPPYLWQCTARSLDATEIVAFSASSLRAVAERNAGFGRDLVTRMSQVLLHRLEATRLKLREFHGSVLPPGAPDCLSREADDAESAGS